MGKKKDSRTLPRSDFLTIAWSQSNTLRKLVEVARGVKYHQIAILSSLLFTISRVPSRLGNFSGPKTKIQIQI